MQSKQVRFRDEHDMRLREAGGTIVVAIASPACGVSRRRRIGLLGHLAHYEHSRAQKDGDGGFLRGYELPSCSLSRSSFSWLVDSGRFSEYLLSACHSHSRTRQKTGDADLIDDAEELHELLRTRLRIYEETLATHGIELPYSGPLANSR